MDSPWFAIWFLVTTYAWIQSVLLLLQADQHRHFARKRLAQNYPFRSSRRVALFVPCKGLDVELRQNLRPLLEQDFGAYDVTFILDDASDPAAATIQQLIAEYPGVAARIAIAGRAVDTGQKVHNLRHATADLPSGVDVLAFVDSDARPRPDWLRRLTCRLERDEVGAVTGYRWLIPVGGGWASRLLASVNGSVAAMLGRGGHHLVWGGSWAIRRDVFEKTGLREAWRGTLSDDLVASRVLHRAGYLIEFEPCCMLASPIEAAGGQALGFLRRQYLMGRYYFRSWWVVALLGSTAATLGFWSSVLAAGVGFAAQASWTWAPTIACVLLFGVNAARAAVQQRLACIYGQSQNVNVSPGAAEILAWPIVGLANWFGLIGSMFGSRLTWRGIRYRLSRAGRLIVEQPDSRPAFDPSGSEFRGPSSRVAKNPADRSRRPLTKPAARQTT